MSQQTTEQSSHRRNVGRVLARSWLEKLLSARLRTIWFAACLIVTAVWMFEEADVMRSPLHVHGVWSFQLTQNWGGEICLELFRDFPKPNVGPKLGPGHSETPEELAREYKLPVAIYRGTIGFDYNTSPNYEITQAGNMILRGTQIDLRMPEWAAIVMWLPLGILWLRRLRNNRAVRKGFCGSCGYDLRATRARCPECGAMPVLPSEIIGGRAVT